jgi:hypothetical protein
LAVRVRVRLCAKTSGNCVETCALVNSGYETDSPEILVPRSLAEYLNIALHPPRARTYIYETPFGLHRLVVVEGEVTVSLMGVGSVVDNVTVAVSGEEREVLISDALASELGIQLIDVRGGGWRHKNDPTDVLRPSCRPEYW